MEHVYAYDFDGVVSIGINPRYLNDVIITGRCIDEEDYVRKVLKERGIKCDVYFNPMTLAERGNHTEQARTFSGNHKVETIKRLRSIGKNIKRFFEDDPLQLEIIKNNIPDLEVVHVISNLVEK